MKLIAKAVLNQQEKDVRLTRIVINGENVFLKVMANQITVGVVAGMSVME